MLRAFGHRVAKCCYMLGVVGSNLTSFKLEPTTPNMSQHIATPWPNACNMLRPTMLRHVALACCDRLARALRDKIWALQMVTRASPKFNFIHFFHIIIIIIRCSGMFRDFPECSGMFHVPDFIDAPFGPLWRVWYSSESRNGIFLSLN